MITIRPVELEGYGVRLEPLTLAHEQHLAAAAADGALWELWFTVVPAREETRAYIERALEGQRQGSMLPWVVRNFATGKIVGSTRFHDSVASGQSKRWARRRTASSGTSARAVTARHAT